MTENNSSATRHDYYTFKSPSGTIIQTPDNKPPVYGTPITIHDGSGNSKSGKWINNEAAEDS